MIDQNLQRPPPFYASWPQAISQGALPWWTAPLLPLAVAVLIDWMRRAGSPMPTPFLLLFAAVAIAASVSGFRGGMAAAAIMAGFILHAGRISFGPPTLTGGPFQMSVGILGVFGVALYLGLVRHNFSALLAEAQRTAALLASRHQTLEDHLPEMVLLLDRTGRVLHQNRPAGKILGHLGEHPQMNQILHQVHPEDRGRFQASWQALVTGPVQTTCTLRYRIQDGQGQQHTLECVGVNLLQTPGVEGVLITGRDVTEMERTEQIFQKLWHASPNGLLLLDERGHIRKTNTRITEILGYQEKDLLGRSYEFLVPQGMVHRHAAYHAAFLAEGRSRNMDARLDTHAQRKDGSLIPVDIGLGPVDMPEGPYVLVTIRDATEERKLTQEQRTHLRFLEGLTALTQDILLDPSAPPEALPAQVALRLRTLFHADACYITRWGPDQDVATPAAAADHSQEHYTFPPRPAAETITGYVLNRNETLIIEDVETSPLITPDRRARYPRQKTLLILPLRVGEFKWGAVILAYHQPRTFAPQEVAWAEQAADLVTLALHRAQLHAQVLQQTAELEAQVAERSAALHNSFHVSPALKMIGGTKGQMIRCNRSWEVATGRSRATLLSQPWWSHFHPEDQIQIHEALAQAQESGAPSLEIRVRVLDKQGAEKWYAWRMVVDGAKVYATGWNIDEQRAMEQKLRQAREEAEAANRAKSTFLAAMSHELRTPLNGILGFADLLILHTRDKLEPRQQRYVENIRHSGHHLLSLINDLLDLSKIEAGRQKLDLSPVQIQQSICTVMDNMAPLFAERRHEVTLKTPETLPLVIADEEKVQQIFYNLLSNAAKYTPCRGHITVTVERKMADPPSLQICVQDSGVGIAAEDLERIFQPFEQVDSAYHRATEGTGLGLALTRGLVELHGGRIWAESPGPGQGSAFYVELPLTPPDYLRRLKAPGRPPLALIVEDSLNDGSLNSLYLTDAGLSVIFAYTAAQAIELIHIYRPDVIVLDILMPHTDGWRVCEALEQDPLIRDTPVVVVSITEDRARGRRYGIEHWFVKPVEREALVAAVKEALARGRPVAKALVVCGEPEKLHALSLALEEQRVLVESAAHPQDALVQALRLRPDYLILVPGQPRPQEYAHLAQQVRRHDELVDCLILEATEQRPAAPVWEGGPPLIQRLAQGVAGQVGLHLHPYPGADAPPAGELPRE